MYQQCAKVHTDYWEAYQTVIPSKRHEAVGKDSGKTSYIERLNNTFRQRIARLVRKSLSFSKKVLKKWEITSVQSGIPLVSTTDKFG